MSNFQDYFTEIKYWPTVSPVKSDLRSLSVEGTEVVIKDENTQTTGSFKDRGLYYQLGHYLSNGLSKFILSSSGNSAISATAMLPMDGHLELFLSSNISQQKLQLIEKYGLGKKVNINMSDKPRSQSMQFERENTDYINLRGSKDEKAWPGYMTIAYELEQEYPEIDAIFIPCSSGTSTVGIYEGFKKLNKKVSIHICQTQKIQSIAKKIKNVEKADFSLADAIVDKVAHRREQVLKIITETNGNAWIVRDAELEKAKLVFEKSGYEYSYNSLLAYCAYIQASEEIRNFTNPVLLFSGR